MPCRDARGKPMKNRTIGITLGVAGVVLWFMPMLQVGINVYATGRQIGNISYLLVGCFATYALLSCFQMHRFRVITAGTATAVSLLLLFEAWSNAAWGLYSICAVSVLSWLAACIDWSSTRDVMQSSQG